MYNFTLVNLDTDSISFCKPDQTPFTEEEQKSLLTELNSLYPEKIKFEHDGMFDTVCILKAKNYILKSSVCKKCKKSGLKECNHEARITKKGSSLKSSKIEVAIKNFMNEIITVILEARPEEILSIYHKYIRLVHDINDISDFCSKKTITQAVLNPTRTQEENILDALNGRSVQMGDKIYVYFAEKKTIEKQEVWKTNRKTKEKEFKGYVDKEIITYPLKLKEDWRGDHSIDSLLEKLYNTIVIFKNVIDIKQFPKYHNARQKDALKQLLEG